MQSLPNASVLKIFLQLSHSLIVKFIKRFNWNHQHFLGTRCLLKKDESLSLQGFLELQQPSLLTVLISIPHFSPIEKMPAFTFFEHFVNSLPSNLLLQQIKFYNGILWTPKQTPIALIFVCKALNRTAFSPFLRTQYPYHSSSCIPIVQKVNSIHYTRLFTINLPTSVSKQYFTFE